LQDGWTNARTQHMTWIVVFLVIVIVLLCFKCVLNACTKCLIRKFDMTVFGQDCSLGTVKFSFSQGGLVCKNFTIGNPEEFHSKQLLRIGRIDAQMKKRKYLASCGKVVEIRRLWLTDVDVHCDFEEGVDSKTNIDEVIDYIAGWVKNARQGSRERERKVYILHEVLFKDVRVFVHERNQTDRVVEMNAVVYQDFSREHKKQLVVEDLARTLVHKVLENALKAARRHSSKGVWQTAKDLKQKVKNTAKSALEQANQSANVVGETVTKLAKQLRDSLDADDRGKAQDSAEQLLRLKEALIKSQLSPEYLCPVHGLTESHFRELAGATATTSIDYQGENLFKKLSRGKSRMEYEEFVKWLET